MELVEKAHRLSKELGIKRLTANILSNLAVLSWTRGEYDLAIRSNSRALALFQGQGGLSDPYADLGHIPIWLSVIYGDLGNKMQSFEWAESALESEYEGGPGGLEEHACPHFAMANALIHLGRLKEASVHLEKTQRISLKSGLELQLARHYYYTGLYEIATDNFPTGVQTIEEALKIFERTRRQYEVNRCLLALTRTEIELFKIESQEMDPMDSGPWMIRLEREAREKNLPGILIQHALLKAQFQEKLGQKEAARDTLMDALDISDSPGVRTLRNMVMERVSELDTSASSPEV